MQSITLCTICLKLYCQHSMAKISRSSSEFLHRRLTSEQEPIARIPREMEERLLKKTAELFAKNQSRILHPNGITPARNEKQQLTRNKSLSTSKSKLFEKAHQVTTNETFQRPFFAQNLSNFPLGASNINYSQYKNTLSQSKVNEIAQRKLLISKVIANNDDNKSKLTLRGQVFKSQLQKQNNKKIEEKRYHHQQQASIEYEQPKELTQSKQFFLERSNDLGNNRSKAIQNNESFNLSSSNLINEQRLKIYSKQLEANIKQSIKKEMEEHFQIKQKELQHRYLQKEKHYLQKFKQLQTVMESQLQKQRNILLSSISDQLQKQLQKTHTIQYQQSKPQKKVQFKQSKYPQQQTKGKIRKESSNNVKSSLVQPQQEQEQIVVPKEDKQPSLKKPNTQININKVSQPNPNELNKRKDSISIPKENKKLDEIKQIDYLDQLKEAKPVERVKPSPSEVGSTQPKNNNKIVAQQQEKKSTKPNRLLGQDKTKKSNSIYNEAEESYLDQIQEVKLKLQSKMSPQKPINNLKDKYQRVNQSFNVQKKLNDSFTSQKPAPVNKAPKIQKMPPVKKQTEEEKRIAKQEERKALVRNKLKEQIKNDENVIAIGQVAGYCSKYCKNSKVDWRVSSLLLYRYCFDFFRSFKQLYQQALDLNLIKKEQLEKYNSYDEVMEQNLAKMYKSISKKITLSTVYKEIIESDQLELERLKPYALLEAKNYIRQLVKSKESKPKQGDPLVIQCGLRVINSVYIIRKLNGANVELLTTDIQKLGQQELYNLFEKWSSKLLQEE